MNRRSEDAVEATDAQDGRAERRRRASVVGCFATIVIVIDAILFFLVIPWVDSQDWSKTQYGSVGFAVFFVMVLFTFVSFVALVAFFFSSSSYAADNWR